MKRFEFLERARALAQQQCADSSCLTDEEFAVIEKTITAGESSEEVELYKKALEITTDASHDMDSNFMEASRTFSESL